MTALLPRHEADWRRLLSTYQPLLHVWMGQLGVRAPDADDLAQEVLLVVFREVRGFKRQAKGRFAVGFVPCLPIEFETIFANGNTSPPSFTNSTNCNLPKV